MTKTRRRFRVLREPLPSVAVEFLTPSTPKNSRRTRTRLSAVCAASILVVAATAFYAARNSPFAAWRRLSHQPILSPQASSWKSAGTFNAAAVRLGPNYAML